MILSTLSCSTLHPSQIIYKDHQCVALYDCWSSWNFLSHSIGTFQMRLSLQILFALACFTLCSSLTKIKKSLAQGFPWWPIDLKFSQAMYQYLSDFFVNLDLIYTCSFDPVLVLSRIQRSSVQGFVCQPIILEISHAMCLYLSNPFANSDLICTCMFNDAAILTEIQRSLVQGSP
jgi:hypothetical protein